MKKNLIKLITVLAVLALLLSACAQKPDDPKPADTAQPAATDVPADATEAPEATPTEEPTDTPDPTDTPAPTAAAIEPGTNVALTAELEVSSSTGPGHVQWGWSYEYINDGVKFDTSIPNLGWTTAVGLYPEPEDAEVEEWVLFELETYTNVNKMVVFPTIDGSCFPVDFHVEVSLNGKDFTTVASVEGNESAVKRSSKAITMEFDPCLVKYVKFVITRMYDVPSGADGLLCQLCEIEVYSC